MKTEKAREYTLAEVREEFIDRVRGVADYWASVPGRSDPEKCEGVAFSILVLLDGMNCSMPGFALTPSPHPDDKAYHRQNGENWYPTKGDIREDVMMHDCFYRMEAEKEESGPGPGKRPGKRET